MLDHPRLGPVPDPLTATHLREDLEEAGDQRDPRGQLRAHLPSSSASGGGTMSVTAATASRNSAREITASIPSDS
jgi:hypothetical protein